MTTSRRSAFPGATGSDIARGSALLHSVRLYRIRQRFASRRLDDVADALRRELQTCGISIRPGARIAIAVGSRGIANLPVIVNAVVAWVHEHAAEPFIVPAMGSHGGATAEGQQKILEGFGLSGIVSSMEVVQLGPDTFIDRHAFESDGVILINRIKPHTSFHGTYESGLMKMLAVGLSKHAGATAIHRHGVAGLHERIPTVARQVLATGKILFGVAIVDNACDETMVVRAIPATRIPDEEPALLELARANMPSLPIQQIDLLIVDEIGKEISGTGMDTNVIGRLRITGEPEPSSPRIKKIFVRDLRGDSAYGIGLADVTTRRLVEKTDWDVTNTNVQASGFFDRGKLPQVAESDEQALEFALRGFQPDEARVIRIRNTLHLENMLVSEPLLKEFAGRETIEVVGPARIWDAL